MTPKYVMATYGDPELEEYRGNPLIEALPPINDMEQAAQLLHTKPPCSDADRRSPTRLRLQKLGRIKDLFIPLPVAFDLEQRFSRMIRRGYLSRNPLEPGARGTLLERIQALEAAAAKGKPISNRPAYHTSQGFTVVGVSGVGKSTTILRILNTYPQVIAHKNHPEDPAFSDLQLVWMHLQCPARASLLGLGKSFIEEVDSKLGTPYWKLYRPDNATAEDVAIAMSRIAANQHLGVLVVDEFQNLLNGKSGGAEEVLNFFVELVNRMHVPIVLVGTPRAKKLLKEVRQARRGTGEGDLTWGRMMESDEEWKLFTKALWRYQYVKTPVERTPELQHVLYEESQGIADFAVKIFILAQVRSMLTKVETLDEEFLREAARKDLSMLQPLLEALRNGDEEALAQFEDVTYKDFVESRLEEAVSEAAREESLAVAENELNNAELNTAEEKLEAVIALLEQSPVDSGTAQRVARRAMKELGLLASEAELFRLAFELAMADSPPAERREGTKGRSTSKKGAKRQPEQDDLREITKSGAANGLSGYEALKSAGVVKPPGRSGSDNDLVTRPHSRRSS